MAFIRGFHVLQSLHQPGYLNTQVPHISHAFGITEHLTRHLAYTEIPIRGTGNNHATAQHKTIQLIEYCDGASPPDTDDGSPYFTGKRPSLSYGCQAQDSRNTQSLIPSTVLGRKFLSKTVSTTFY